jgi:hypothetical protein
MKKRLLLLLFTAMLAFFVTEIKATVPQNPIQSVNTVVAQAPVATAEFVMVHCDYWVEAEFTDVNPTFALQHHYSLSSNKVYAYDDKPKGKKAKKTTKGTKTTKSKTKTAFETKNPSFDLYAYAEKPGRKKGSKGGHKGGKGKKC